jgi:hypothetical protein
MARSRIRPPQNAVQTIEGLAKSGKSIIGIAKHFGTSVRTFKRWCEEDEDLQEAFDSGRDMHKDYLVALVTQAAVANKGANANAMFLLKAMHGFREIDSPNNRTNVNVAVAAPSVMYVIDHGSDDQWAAKAAAQQAALAANAGSPRQIIEGMPLLASETSSEPLTPSLPTEAREQPTVPAWRSPALASYAPAAPSWRGNA